MSSFSEYFTALNSKLANSTYVTDTSNITFGESPDIASYTASKFPRLEILIVKLKCNGYVSQRKMTWAIRYAIVGYIATDTDSFFPTVSEINEITNFSKETVDLNYQFLNDKQAGTPPCTGFETLGQYPEIFIEKELIPKTITFIADVEAQILIPDTEVL